MSFQQEQYMYQEEVPVLLDEYVTSVDYAPGDLIKNLDRIHRYKAGLSSGADLVARTRERISQLAHASPGQARRLFLMATGGSCEGKTSYLADWAHTVRVPEQQDTSIDLLQSAYLFPDNIFVRYAAFSWSALVDAVLKQQILPDRKGAWSASDLFFLNNLFFVSMQKLIEEYERSSNPKDVHLYSIDLPAGTGYFDANDRKIVHGKDRGLTVLRRVCDSYGAKQVLGLSVVCSNEAFFRNLSIRNIHHTREDKTSGLLIPLGDMGSFRLARTMTAPVAAAMAIRGQIQSAVIAHHGDDMSYSYSLAAPLYTYNWRRAGILKHKKRNKHDFLIGDTSMDVLGMPWYDGVQARHDRFMTERGQEIIEESSNIMIKRRLIVP